MVRDNSFRVRSLFRICKPRRIIDCNVGSILKVPKGKLRLNKPPRERLQRESRRNYSRERGFFKGISRKPEFTTIFISEHGYPMIGNIRSHLSWATIERSWFDYGAHQASLLKRKPIKIKM